MAYIADTASVDETQSIVDDARVEDSAVVKYTTVMGAARVGGSAQVVNSVVSGFAIVEGASYIEKCEVYAEAHIYGKVDLYKVKVGGSSSVFGNAFLENNLDFPMQVALSNCKIGGRATFKGLNTPDDYIKKYGADKVTIKPEQLTLTDVWDMG